MNLKRKFIRKLLVTHIMSSLSIFSHRPVDHLITVIVRTVASGSGRQHRVGDQRRVQSLRGQGVRVPLWRACMRGVQGTENCKPFFQNVFKLVQAVCVVSLSGLFPANCAHEAGVRPLRTFLQDSKEES